MAKLATKQQWRNLPVGSLSPAMKFFIRIVLIESSPWTIFCQSYASSWSYLFLEARPKLQWVTNTDRSGQSKKRSLQYDDTDDGEEQVENAPLSKRQSAVIKNEHETEETIRSSVIDDEELDFL